MKILVTGSRGTLGVPLVAELRKRGHEVWGCDLQHSDDPQYVRADVADYRQLERVFCKRNSVVYHLAAEFGRNNGEDYYEQLWRTNVVGTRNILELQRRVGFKLIFASSSEIYGDRVIDCRCGAKGNPNSGRLLLACPYCDKKDAMLSEDLPLSGCIQPNDYAISKWVNEVQIQNFAQRYGTETVRVRIFNTYGPGEHYHSYRSVVCLFAYRALYGLPYEVYEGYKRSFMFIGDFIPTLANVCERFVPGEVYNIGGAEYRSVRELSDLVLKACGKDDRFVKYLPEDTHNVRNKRADIRKAREAFGHDPRVTLEEGVPLTVKWMKKVYGAV